MIASNTISANANINVNNNGSSCFTVNLSDIRLTEPQLSVLDRGLTFIPAYRTLLLNDVYAAQDRLVRNLKLKDYFMGQNNEDDYNPHRKTFTYPSTWTPPDHKICQPTLNTINRIVNTTESVIRRHRIINNRLIVLDDYRDNLTSDERGAIMQLRNNPDIVIKPADKGSATVIMKKSAYIAEAHRQLDNALYYRKLDRPIYTDNIAKINEILREMENLRYISLQQLRYLEAKATDRPRIFYLLPKIHKPRTKWPQPDLMPEGRPIVSDTGSESYRVSEYINYFIRPISTRHRSYLKDTYDFVNKVRHQIIPEGAFLVTGDVTALYTNMNIDRTLSVARRALHRHHEGGRPDEYILRLLELTLKNNDFVFDGEFYLQICGTAMGKSYAPGLADLYMEDFDDGAIDGYNVKPLLFNRFLDDIFFIWTGTLQQLREYEIYLNNLITGIKVTLNQSQESIDFLDTTVYVADNNVLLTRVHFKETDTHQLLHKMSFHPRHTAKGVLKSQLIRFKRISSTFADYDSASRILFGALAKRHYSKSLMRKMKREIWTMADNNRKSRTRLLNLLPIVVPYNEFGTTLALQWRSIIADNGLFADLKPINAYTTGRNLRNTLVRSQLTPAATQPRTYTSSTPTGCTRCSSNRCSACNYITAGKRCTSSVNKRRFLVRGNINCRTNNVVYLVTCNRCQLQYVGETTRPLADRINDHLSCIRTHKNTPVSLHFNTPGHSIGDFTIMGIEQIANEQNPTSTLLLKERTWQNLLQTAYPLGINNLKERFLKG